jgi:peptide/nickel transport system substrate-binding protein
MPVLKMPRLYRLIAALLVVGAVVIWTRTARAPKSVSQNDKPVSGGRLVATFRSEPKTFNRLVSAQSGDELVALLTQASLVRVNRVTGELEPALAREWTSSPDGLTWTLKLREGVQFSDGTPFTSADVLFTFQALYDKAVASEIASGFEIDGKPITVRAPDEHTVIVTFPAPYGPGLRLLDALPILPRHKLAGALAAGTFREAWSVTTPPAEIAGLGPFVLKSYAPGQRLVFERNPHYWRHDGRGTVLPYLDELDVDIVPEQNAELLRLESGDADLTTSEVRPEDLAVLQPLAAKGTVQLVKAGVSINADGLWFNLTPGAGPARDRPWLQREELRKAVSYAIDRQAIVNTVYLGEATPIYGPVTPGAGDWYDANLPRTEHDAARARALLASIGLTDRNGDGMLEDAAGKPARFALLTQKGQTIRERAAALIQDELRQVGLTVDIVALDTGTLITHFSRRDYDAMYFGVSTDSPDPARNLDYWLSSGSFHFWNANQSRPATTWEGQIDDLMRRESTTLDHAQARQLFDQVQQIMAEHLPVIYLAAPTVTVAMSARVHGATPSVLPPSVLWNAEAVWVSGSGGGSRHP